MSVFNRKGGGAVWNGKLGPKDPNWINENKIRKEADPESFPITSNPTTGTRLLGRNEKRKSNEILLKDKKEGEKEGGGEIPYCRGESLNPAFVERRREKRNEEKLEPLVGREVNSGGDKGERVKDHNFLGRRPSERVCPVTNPFSLRHRGLG